MKKTFSLGIFLLATFAVSGAPPIAAPSPQQEHAPAPAWNPGTFRDCDRACLIGIMDGYMNALFAHDPRAVPPLALDVRLTENTGHL